MQIRTAELMDAKCMAKLHVDVWRAAYKGIMPDSLLGNMDINYYEQCWSKTLRTSGNGKYLVAQIDKELVGFATFGPTRDADLEEANSVELVAINISPEYWRQAIGSQLLSSVIDSVKGKYTNIYLWVTEKNIRAISLYENFGFNPDGKTKTDNSHGDIVELRYAAQL